jgi:uncharacterized membrane protein
MAAEAVLSAVPTPAERARPLAAAGAGLTGRAALLGLATGGRSALGLGAPGLTSRDASGLKKAAAAASLAAELVADKLPGTPARTGGGPLSARLGAAAGGAGLLAGREGVNAALPVAAGVAGAAAGSFGGLAWRRWAGARVPDWQAAVAEDLVAVGLALLACRPARRPRPTLVAVPD